MGLAAHLILEHAVRHHRFGLLTMCIRHYATNITASRDIGLCAAVATVPAADTTCHATPPGAGVTKHDAQRRQTTSSLARPRLATYQALSRILAGRLRQHEFAILRPSETMTVAGASHSTCRVVKKHEQAGYDDFPTKIPTKQGSRLMRLMPILHLCREKPFLVTSTVVSRHWFGGVC